MKTHIETSKEFKCSTCDKEFFLQWRLNQHIKGHAEKERKFCHYFNNFKSCPFEEIGCRFNHDHAAFCKFEKLCTMTEDEFGDVHSSLFTSTPKREHKCKECDNCLDKLVERMNEGHGYDSDSSFGS